MRKPPKVREEKELERWIRRSSEWHHLYAEDAWIYHDLYVSPQKFHGRCISTSPPVH